MKAAWFRVIKDGVPTGRAGMVFGRDDEDLFWAVDEYVDPYAVEVRPARWGGFCMLVGDGDNPNTEHETGGAFPGIEDNGWKLPSWRR
jgi:hypothetical protein